MTGAPVRYYKHLILLGFFLSLSLLGSRLTIFAETPRIFQNPTVISPQGKYDSFTPRGDIRRFNGETLTYDIDFLFFDNAAVAKVRFYQYRGKYYSTLEAETKGVVGFFTNYRKHFYKAAFEITDNGRRVRTTKFEREVVNGDEKERTDHFLDYKSPTHFWLLFKGGELKEQHRDPITEGVLYDDILAFFYNFRNGVYGDLKKGATYKVDTLPDKSMKIIDVYINTEKEEKQVRIDENRPTGEEMLLKVLVPKDVFETENGELIFWASNNYIPLETTIKDYVLFGDLHGKLTRGISGRMSPPLLKNTRP